MALAFQMTRLASGRATSLFKLTNANLARSALFTTTASHNVVLKPVREENFDGLNHDNKNILLKRQLSPCLSIYDIQLTSVLSITHRMTGLALTGYAAVFGLAVVLPPHDVTYWISAIESLNLGAGTLAFIKFYIALPATYHTFNGIRHLFWDNAQFLELDNVYKTGYISLAVSTVAALALAFL